MDYIIIADTYRMGKKHMDRPKNIILCFAQIINKDNMLQAGKHLQEYKSTKTLDDWRIIDYLTYKVQNYLPMELVDQKNYLWPAFKRAAQYSHRRQFRVVGAGIYLIVNGRIYIPGVNVITEKGMVLKQSQSQSSKCISKSKSKSKCSLLFFQIKKK